MLRRLSTVLLAFVALAGPLPATWSIILFNTRTGEIAIGCATCLTNLDLMTAVPVLVVGKGAACAQSFIDTSGGNRLLIRDGFRDGLTPAQILADLERRDPQHQTRQYGIVDASGAAVGFTGSAAGAWGGDRTGRMGDIVYALQGNILTGPPVLAAAELAIWSTPGSLADKLMAAMEAARSYGGDGRCSCQAGPTQCGSPPPSFGKSAHIGFMVVARRGDRDGACTAGVGCAAGNYYLNLNVANQTAGDADPVEQLDLKYRTWKRQQVGRPDHFLSSVEFDQPELPDDGRATVNATVVLRDLDGTPLTQGGARITTRLDPSSTAAVTLGRATDNGDGTYTVPVTAGSQIGTARIEVTVDDGSGARALFPLAEIGVRRFKLWADKTRLSVAAGGTVEFSLNTAPVPSTNRPWVLLASNSGTSPGIFAPPFAVIPLNPDPVFFALANVAFQGLDPELIGIMPPDGRAFTSFTFPPGSWALPPGTDLAFAYALFNPVNFASNPVVLELVR